MKVGDVVVPTRQSHKVLHCGSGMYSHAIVASLEPFVLVSEDGSMLWRTTWQPHEVEALCQASKEIQEVVEKRWLKERFPSIEQPNEQELAKYGIFTGTPSSGPNHVKELWEQSIAGGVDREALKQARRAPFFAYEASPGGKVSLQGLWDKLRRKDDCDRYRTSHHQQYVRPSGNSGYTSIPVLEFLWGLPLCNLTLAYVDSLEPYAIRITSGECTTDAVTGRVTILTEERDGEEYVRRIDKEVRVLYSCGSDIGQALRALKENKFRDLPAEREEGMVIGDPSKLAQADFS